MTAPKKLTKLRADSTFARLSAEELAEVDEMLLSGAGYADVQAYLAERDLRCSQTSVADYYQTHVVPQKWARVNKVARNLGTLSAEGADEATLNQLRALTMDMALTPGADLKSIRVLYTLVLKARQLELDDRRIKLLEKKAAQAEKAEQVAKDAAATAEEKELRIKEIFGIC